MKQFLIALIPLFIGFCPGIEAHDDPYEQEMYFTTDSPEKFIDVIDSLTKNCSDGGYIVKSETPEMLSLNVDIYPDYYLVRGSKKHAVVRNFNRPVTAEERKDITFIITTLAKSSLASLATSKSALNKAGDRIDSVHPFRFLQTVFTDETLKASVSAIRSRSWVRDQFFDGLQRSLKEESQKNNLTVAQVNEFSASIGIDSTPIQNAVDGKRWKELINFLIDTIPRSGNQNLYDM